MIYIGWSAERLEAAKKLKRKQTAALIFAISVLLTCGAVNYWLQ